MDYKLLFLIYALVGITTSVQVDQSARQHSTNKVKNQPLLVQVRQVSCTNAETNSMVGHPGNCQSYYYCATRDSAPVYQSCPGNQHFNAQLQTCDYPENVGCNARRAGPNRRPEPKQVQNQIPLRCLLQPANVSCDNVGDNYLIPHPSDCHLFYYCIPNVRPICRQCPAHLHFSPISQVCEYPQNAGCGNKTFTSPSPTQNVTAIDTTTPPNNGTETTESAPLSTEQTSPDASPINQTSTEKLGELITPLAGGSIVTEILPDTTTDASEPSQFDETTLTNLLETESS